MFHNILNYYIILLQIQEIIITFLLNIYFYIKTLNVHFEILEKHKNNNIISKYFVIINLDKVIY